MRSHLWRIRQLEYTEAIIRDALDVVVVVLV